MCWEAEGLFSSGPCAKASCHFLAVLAKSTAMSRHVGVKQSLSQLSSPTKERARLSNNKTRKCGNTARKHVRFFGPSRKGLLSWSEDFHYFPYIFQHMKTYSGYNCPTISQKIVIFFFQLRSPQKPWLRPLWRFLFWLLFVPETQKQSRWPPYLPINCNWQICQI